MFSYILGADIFGMEARLVRVEADVHDGLPVFDMVGCLASAVKEARDRVRIAIRNAGIFFPAKRITVNLSPANLKKEGTSFDLPIAISLLTSFGYLPVNATQQTLIVGELGLDGSVRPVNGVLAMMMEAQKNGINRFIVPKQNAIEGSVLKSVEVYGVSSLADTMEFIKGNLDISKEELRNDFEKENIDYSLDFSDVYGQSEIKQAVEIAVSGNHNLLMIGPPGSGKTMIAKRIPTIMPELSYEESLELTRIYSICGCLPADVPLVRKRPFRAPHHTVTDQTIAGGGRPPVPGEISMASKGVLFLDELPEFSRSTIEVLRQPMEEHKVTVSRVGYSYEYPSDCIIVAAMNPCKCGFYPDYERCRCTTSEIHRYIDKISEPLLDRMDLCVEAKNLDFHLFGKDGEDSKTIRKRVEKTVQIQKERYIKEEINYNSELSENLIEKYVPIKKNEEDFLREYYLDSKCSMRQLTRIIKVSRTIADIGEKDCIEVEDIAKAIMFRSINKKYWG